MGYRVVFFFSYMYFTKIFYQSNQNKAECIIFIGSDFNPRGNAERDYTQKNNILEDC